MNVERARLMWHSVRHTRPSQLAWRGRLLIKRQACRRLAPLLRQKLASVGAPPAVRDEPPPPPLPARDHLIEQADEQVYLRYLNRRDALVATPDWHPPQLTALEKLNLHYMEYLEALDDDWFVALVNHWIAHNPPYGPGYWVGNWNSYALSIRCVVWMQQLAVRREALPADFINRTTQSLYEQLRFLERNVELDIRGNHLIRNIKALLWAARFFEPGPDTARWARLGTRLLRTELSEQILPDGMHEERSPAYHDQVFADLLECYAVMDEGPAREALGERLDAMAQVTADMAHTDGYTSLFNDAGLTMAYPPAASLALWRRLRQGEAAPRDHFALPEAGYFGLRSSAGDLLIVDCGPIAPDHLPAHGHGDILAFELDRGGRRMIVDAGVYEYRPGPWRDAARATASHNTVTVGGADQCEFWKSFRVGRRGRGYVDKLEVTSDRLMLAGHHDGYHRLPGAPTHHRRVDAEPGSMTVRDRVEGGASQSVEARLLLHPEAEVDLTADGATIRRPNATLTLETEHPVRVIDAWWMPDFGQRIPTRQLVLAYGPCPCAGGFRLSHA